MPRLPGRSQPIAGRGAQGHVMLFGNGWEASFLEPFPREAAPMLALRAMGTVSAVVRSPSCVRACVCLRVVRGG